MRQLITGAAIAVAAVAAVAGQEGLTGRWRGATQSGTPVMLDLEATKSTLTGTLTTEGHEYPIADGKVSGNAFTFRAAVMDRTEGFSGELAEGRITIRMDTRPGNPAVLNRVQPGAISGKWEGHTSSGTPLALDVVAKGATLTGTITRSGESAPLTDGKATKYSLAFKATFGGQTEAVSGEVDGDQLTLWLDRQGRDRAAILKRVKD